jgi:hypothetical protein
MRWSITVSNQVASDALTEAVSATIASRVCGCSRLGELGGLAVPDVHRTGGARRPWLTHKARSTLVLGLKCR